MGFGSPIAAEDARILCCWRGNVMVALVWGWCLRVLWNIAWLAFWFAIGLNWMVFVAAVPIVILILVLIGWKLKSRRFYVGLLVTMFTLLILDFGYLIYLIVSASMTWGALRGYVADAVARQGWKHGTTTALLILFAVAQIISILTDIYFIFLTRRILAYLRRIASAPTDEEHQLPSLALPPRPGNGALTPNTAAKFAKFSSALQDQRISGDEPYIMAHISPQIEFPAGPPSLDSTIPDADAPDDYYYDGDVDDHPPGRVRALTNGLETSEVLSKDREFSDSTAESMPPSLAEIPFYKPSEPLPAKTPPRPPKNLDIPKWEQMQYVSDSDEENATRLPRRPQYLDISTPGSANYSHLYDEYKTFDSDVVREVIRKATDASGVASPLVSRKFEANQNLEVDDFGNRDRATTLETRSYDLSPEALQEYGYSVDIDRPIAPVSDDEKQIPSPVSDDSPPGVVGFSRTPRQVRHDGNDPDDQFNLTRESVHSRKSLNDTVSFWTQGRASMRNTRSESNSVEDEEYSVEDEDEDGNGTDITTSGTPDDDVSLATAGETSEDDDQRSLATLQNSGEDEDEDSRSEVESNTTVVTSSSDFDEIDDDEIAKLRFDDHKFDEEMAQLKKDLTKVVTATALLPEARPSRNSQSDDAFSTAPTSPAVARVGEGNPLSSASLTEPQYHDSTLLTTVTKTDYDDHSDGHFHVEQSSSVFDNISSGHIETPVYHPKTPSVEVQSPSQAKLTRSPELIHRPYTVDDFDTTLEVKTIAADPVSTWKWQSKTTENWNHLIQDDHTDGLQQEAVRAVDSSVDPERRSVLTNKVDEEAPNTTSKRVSFDFSNVEQPAPTRKSSVSTEEEWRVVDEAYVVEPRPEPESVLTKNETEGQMSSETVIERTKTGTLEVGDALIRDSSFSFSSVDEGDPWSTKVRDIVAESGVNEANETVLPTDSSSEDEEEEWRIVEEGEEVRTTVVPILPPVTTVDQFSDYNGSASHRNEAYILGTYTTARDEENVSHGGVATNSFNYSHHSPPLTTYSNTYDLPVTPPTEPTTSIFDDDTLNWQSSTIAEHHIHLTGSLETIAEESETGATVPAPQPPPMRQPSTPLRPPPQILVSGTHDQYPSSDDDDSDQKSLSTLDDAEDSARRRAIKLSRSDSECTERSLSSASGVSSIHGHGKGAVKKASAISDDDSDEVASLATLETRSQVSGVDSDAGDDLSLASASGGSGRTTPTHASGHSQGSRWQIQQN